MRILKGLLKAIYEKTTEETGEAEKQREQQVPTLLQKIIAGRTHRDLPETVDKAQSGNFIGRLFEDIANAFARRIASVRLNKAEPNNERAKSEDEAREREEELIRSYNARMRENQSFGDQMGGKYDDENISKLELEERIKRANEERKIRGEQAQSKATEEVTGRFQALGKGVRGLVGVMGRFALGFAKVAAVFKISEAVLKSRQAANFDGAQYSAALTQLQAEDYLREETRRAERARNRESSSRYFSDQYNNLQEDLQVPKSAIENASNYLLGGAIQAVREWGPAAVKAAIPGAGGIMDLVSEVKDINGKMPAPMTQAARAHFDLKEILDSGSFEKNRQAQERHVGPGSR